MKRLSILLLGAIMAAGFTANAQNCGKGMGMGMGAPKMNPDSLQSCNIPNLTPDQQKKIYDLRVAHIKAVTPLRNQLAEKYAHLKTLESAEKPDLNAINKTIDEIVSIKGQLMKSRAAHRADVSALLTDEQKVFFNAHQGMGNRMHQKGMGAGMHQGMEKNKTMGSCQQIN